MKYTLNKLKEKTTNNFKVNDIKLDLDINKLETTAPADEPAQKAGEME